MNKERFLEKLTIRLQVLDEKEKQDILDEYALHIDMKVAEGLSEEEAIQDFGDFEELVADILEAYHVNPKFCTPSKVRKKEWKSLDMSKMKEEGKEACSKAGGFLKRSMKALQKHGKHAYTKIRGFFHQLKNKMKMMCHREQKEKLNDSQDSKRMKGFGQSCKRTFAGVMRGCWNAVCLLTAIVFFVLTAIIVLCFGVLLVWQIQGYPLAGVTLGCLGAILIFGTPAVRLLYFRKKRNQHSGLIFSGIFVFGILFVGLGTGIALKEYASFEYTGIHTIGNADMMMRGEATFESFPEGEEKYMLHCFADEIEVIEDASVPEKTVKYEIRYNQDYVDVMINDMSADGYVCIAPASKAGTGFYDFMRCKDEILKDFKHKRIGTYKTVGIEKVKCRVNPKTAEELYVEKSW